jgi:hypothetical protein
LGLFSIRPAYLVFYLTFTFTRSSATLFGTRYTDKLPLVAGFKSEADMNVEHYHFVVGASSISNFDKSC